MKRTQNVMLRLTAAEHAELLAAKPSDEDLAAFARATLLAAVRAGAADPLRPAAAFIVAALSPDIGFGEALELYDRHVAQDPKEF